MALEHLLDLHTAAMHLGTGVVTAAASATAVHLYNSTRDAYGSRLQAAAVAISGIAAAAVGPDLGAIAQYVHAPTAGGIALGMIGAATAGAVAAGGTGLVIGKGGSGVGAGIAMVYGGALGAVIGTIAYLIPMAMR
jgi:hypothetical protein